MKCPVCMYVCICIYDLISEAEERTIKICTMNLLVTDGWIQYLQVLRQGKQIVISVRNWTHVDAV